MAFIRGKKINGEIVYYLVENRRAGNLVRQRVLVYLGPCSSLAGALEYWMAELARVKSEAEQARAGCDRARRVIDPDSIERTGGEMPKYKRKYLEIARDPYKQYWQKHDLAEHLERKAQAIIRRLDLVRQYLELK
jgi:hypothetical protein